MTNKVTVGFMVMISALAGFGGNILLPDAPDNSNYFFCSSDGNVVLGSGLSSDGKTLFWNDKSESASCSVPWVIFEPKPSQSLDTRSEVCYPPPNARCVPV
jgi:hypothetical protein